VISVPPRVVYDCNIYVQSLININGPAGRCVGKAQSGDVSLFVSAFILNEIRESHRKIPGKYGVAGEQTEALAAGIASVATVVDQVPPVFTYKRDPDDAHYVNLAVSAQANLIVSRDRDLLDLADATRLEAIEFQRLFPTLRILEPVQFLRELDGDAKRSS
jgi:putative PIN family toxin of toxin-antitoxin system